MKILSIIAQKPSSTGSGIYLTELVAHFKNKGHEQEIICATYFDDEINIKSLDSDNDRMIKFNKVIFDTKDLPLKIAGMSDVMPYESIKYSYLAENSDKLSIWQNAFKEKFVATIESFKPDLIICHHLYLLTAMVVNYLKTEIVKNEPLYKPLIFGICHNTDLRQYQQTNLKREYIKDNIKLLDRIFVPSSEHKNKVIDIFDVDDSKVETIGIGYNNNIFKILDKRSDIDNTFNSSIIKILYVGKLSKKKGVLSLVKAFNSLKKENLSLTLIGGAGSIEEYNEIIAECKKSKNKINVLEPMNQKELAIEYNSHDIFVLPSFSEGLPIVPLEAMACGCKLVISDLPGVRDFYNSNVKNASVKYVTLPKLTNVDDASDEELYLFEKRLKDALLESINDNKQYIPKLSNISWEGIGNKILDSFHSSYDYG